jgi:hypothetical protein
MKRKLKIKRETLRNLADEMQNAAGGAVSGTRCQPSIQITCTPTCAQTCAFPCSIQYSVCVHCQL